MEYAGYNKEASSITIGDMVTVTGYGSDAGEVESIKPVGSDSVLITMANDKSGQFKTDKLIRIYQ